jgi:hypothetical protein
MSSVEPAGIWVVQTEFDHADMGYSFLCTDAMVAGMQRMVPTAGSAETSGWPPLDVMAEQHPAPHLFWLKAFRTGTQPRHTTCRRVGRDVCARTDGVRTSHPSP